MEKKGIFRLVYVADAILGLLILAGLAIYAALPWVYNWLINQNFTNFPEDSRKLGLQLLNASGIPAIVLLALALAVTVNITRNKPFIMANARLLGWMGVCSAVISGEFLTAFFFATYSGFRLLIISVFVVFLLLAVLAWVFADLFRTAVEYREENELTI